MKRETKELVIRILLFLFAIILMAVVVVPIDYYIEKPGTAESLTGMVKVDGKEDNNTGSFMLTTVGVQRARVLTALIAKFSDFNELISKEDYLGSATTEEMEAMQQYYMDSSQNAAIQVAMDLADIPHEMKFKGIYILSLTEKSNFKDQLAIGDVITSVDGKTFENSEDFMSYVKGKNVGDTVTITYERDGKTATAKGDLYELETDHKAGIGITLVDHTELTSDTKVTINAAGIGGPSAGLMFTLETYSLLSGKDLRNGHEIAGTGTISSDGTVGRIGGIDKKVVAASKAGAEIFFAPDDEISDEVKEAYPDIKSNYQEALAAAKKIKTDMKIVPVKTVEDALTYLNDLDK